MRLQFLPFISLFELADVYLICWAASFCALRMAFLTAIRIAFLVAVTGGELGGISFIGSKRTGPDQ